MAGFDPSTEAVTPDSLVSESRLQRGRYLPSRSSKAQVPSIAWNNGLFHPMPLRPSANLCSPRTFNSATSLYIWMPEIWSSKISRSLAQLAQFLGDKIQRLLGREAGVALPHERYGLFCHVFDTLSSLLRLRPDPLRFCDWLAEVPLCLGRRFAKGL